MNIVVVIPMFGKEEYTNKCVEAVTANYGTGDPIEILVVDDGSPTPYVNEKVNVIRLEENSGFTVKHHVVSSPLCLAEVLAPFG